MDRFTLTRPLQITLATLVVSGAVTLLCWFFEFSPTPRVASAQSAIAEQAIGDAAPVGDQARQVAPDAFDDRGPGVAGIHPFKEPPDDIDARVRALSESYDRAANGPPDRPLRGSISPPPDDPNAPPRMDSGDPDPDRTHFDPRVQDVTRGVAQ